nr:unnamed protein product [Digitaria exilis]
MFPKIRKYFLWLLPHPSPPSTTPISPPVLLHRVFATASPFAAADYLVAHCGLSRAQARKASKNLSHLKSPSSLDAVIAFLAGLGLSRADIATVVSNDPPVLRADVEKTLAPRVAKLSNLGLSRPEIGRLVLASGNQFSSKLFLRKVELERQIYGSLGKPFQVEHLPSRQFVHTLDFWLRISSSLDDPLRIVKVNNGVLSIDLEKVAIPNITLLQQRGIAVPHSEVPSRAVQSLLTKRTEHLIKALAARRCSSVYY